MLVILYANTGCSLFRPFKYMRIFLIKIYGKMNSRSDLDLIVFLILLMGSPVKSYDCEHRFMSGFLSELLCDYNTDVIPSQNKQLLDVNITFSLLSILRFDEREETLISAGWLSITWIDHILKWHDNRRYENITRVFLKQKEIWKPDIILINTVEHFKYLGFDDLLVILTNDGKVIWEPGHRFKTACSVDIRLYPFDQQQCSFVFSTWMLEDDVVKLSSKLDYVMLDSFEENGEWIIKSSSAKSSTNVENDNALTFLNVTITMQRRRTYYVLTVCIPILVLSILNCMVYILPPESGEKMSACLTILLSYMVYVSFLNDNLPRTSRTASYLVVYLSIMICLSFLSVMNSVIVVVLWNKSEEQNENAQSLVRKYVSCKTCNAKSIYYNDETNDVLDTIPDTHVESDSTTEPVNAKATAISSRESAKRLDKIMLISISTITISMTVVISILLLHG